MSHRARCAPHAITPWETGLAAVALGCASLMAPVPGHTQPADPPYAEVEGPRLHPAPGWPVWLKDFHQSSRTEKTSGIAWAGRDEAGDRCFFLADEIGLIRFCRVAQAEGGGPVDLRLETVGMGASLLRDLEGAGRWDFEALDLDRGRFGTEGPARADSVDGILSVEGHGLNAVDETRVLAIRLYRRPGEGAGPGWRVESLGDAIAEARFWRGQVRADRGLKGVAVSPGYYWLGLESLEPRGTFNTRGAVIYVYERDTQQVGTLRTLGFGIQSVCGLSAPSDTVTVVADRNRQALSVLRWSAEREGILAAAYRFPLDLPAPGGFRYAIPSVEGVTVDDVGDIWCVTDPWHGNHRPVGAAPESVHVYLAAEIPILYKFPGDSVWAAAGLTHLWPSKP